MRAALAIIVAATASAVAADPAQIVSADVRGGPSATATVTLTHGDTGWDDYADGWRVETEDGEVLGTRTLFHPHVEEQPFTRSLSGVPIPGGTQRVYIRARTSVTGWGEDRLAVDVE